MQRWQTLLGSAGLVLGLLGSSDGQGWRGVRPLHATRNDVERLIGPPMEPGGITYDLKNERVNIGYSDVPCTKGWPFGWNVPRGTVTAIRIYFQAHPKLSDLHFDVSKSKKYVDPSGFVHFNNDEEGFSVATEPDEKEVRSIEYFPAASDAHLRCPEAADRQREIENGESAYRLPDISYSDASPKEQYHRLDYFADVLVKRSTDSQVYVIGYAGQRAQIGERQARANRAKDYLTKKGIEGERIVTIDGGHRDPAGVELYIVVRGQPKPLSSPNIYPGNVKIVNDNNQHRVGLTKPF